MIKLFLITVLCFSSTLVQSQKDEGYFLKSLVFGSSVTYIWDGHTQNNNFFQEYTWNMNGGISIHKQVIVGVQLMRLFYRYRYQQWNSSHIYGLFTQYDFIPDKKSKLFAELSFNRGNYCTCGKSAPYSASNLHYLGFGAGIDLPTAKLYDKLYLDLSFYNYFILNKIESKYNYTQYIVGLNYYFGKKIK